MIRSVCALAALAVLLPSALAQGLGLGGLAPASAPGPEAVVANIAVPTDLCTRDFCLQATPDACDGNCILTPLGNTTEYCATACIAAWNSASVQSCLAGQATGVYIQQQLTVIANKCNAGAIAAARRTAAVKKYNTLFPCTKAAAVNATTLLALDTCQTGANATETNCGTQCSGALLDIPAACRNTFPELSAPWNATLSTCIATAEAPGGGDVASGGGVGVGGSGGVDFLGPSSGGSATPPPTDGSAPATAPAALLAALLSAVVAMTMLA